MIKIQKIPRLKNVIFIAAWPGMGSVAVKSALFLKDKLKAQEFARLDAGDYFSPLGATIEEGCIKIPKLPTGKFYFWKNKLGKNDIVIFVSEAQPLQEKNIEYSQQIISFIRRLSVDMVFTFAAMPLPIDHYQEPNVWVSATHRRFNEKIKNSKVKVLTTGQISGLNGLFLGLAKQAGFSGACILGEIPLYAIHIENPKSSLAVLEVMAKFLGIGVDFEELKMAGKVMEEEIDKLVEYLKMPPQEEHAKPISEEEISKIKSMLSAQSNVPESARKKIELLFKQAKQDIAQARMLKKELDEWNAYKEYEDRFLDLFKKKTREDNQ
ncbi:PAC2 family protein [Candidatus Omnitrophota bacterium]